MPTLLYTFSIYSYHFLIWLIAPFYPKAKKWISGRKNIWSQLQHISNDRPLVWVHCASLGEFEQGRPLIEHFKKNYPNYRILLTFFSPSGYEIRKDYALADYIFYLPSDTPFKAQKFIQIARPSIVFFVKYEFWYHYLSTLKKQEIPTFLVSSIFRPNQVFFKWYGSFFRNMLSYFEHIFVQNKISLDLLHKIDCQHCSVAGDTRIDRVLAIKETAKSFPIIEQFVQNEKVLVCGSTWAKDEDLIIEFIQKHIDNLPFKIIIAPHEIHSSHITQIEDKLNAIPSLRYSQSDGKNPSDYFVLIIDNIGMLSSLYRYGTIAYIGGAFGSGLHNILEPTVFGLPVIFGTKYQKFEEAVQLVNTGGAFSIRDYEGLEKQLLSLLIAENYNKARTESERYIEQNKGATNAIFTWLNKSGELRVESGEY